MSYILNSISNIGTGVTGAVGSTVGAVGNTLGITSSQPVQETPVAQPINTPEITTTPPPIIIEDPKPITTIKKTILVSNISLLNVKNITWWFSDNEQTPG